MRLFLFSIAVTVLTVFSSDPALPQEAKSAAVVLDSLVREARLNNPEILAAGHQARASWSRARRAVSWEPPQAGVEFYQAPVSSFPNPLKDQMEYDYFIEQMIPFPGKLSAMGNAARNGARMTEEDAKSVERRVIFDLKSAYAELYLIQRKLELNNENQDLLKRLAETASRRYEVGMENQTDMLRAQTESARLANEGIALRREKNSTEAMINTLLNRPIGQSLGRIDTLETRFPGWKREQLDSLAMAFRPELQAMRFEVEMKKSEVRAAKWEYAPDLTVRLMLKDMAMTPKEYWSFMVGSSLPLAFWAYPKAAAGVEEAKASREKTEASYVQMKNMVLLDVENAWLSLKTNHDLIELNRRNVLPRAELTLASAVSGYKTGKVMFVMLIDVYRMVLMARLDYCNAVMNYAVSQAKLEHALGLNTAEIEDRIRSFDSKTEKLP
jgi:cobalt-zinc-cadmium efflux system outer membrane protein